MSFFEAVQPILSTEDQSHREAGVAVQAKELIDVLSNHAIEIASAVRTEMAATGCTYEEASVKFVQTCDRLVVDHHLIVLGKEKAEG